MPLPKRPQCRCFILYVSAPLFSPLPGAAAAAAGAGEVGGVPRVHVSGRAGGVLRPGEAVRQGVLRPWDGLRATALDRRQ